MNKFTALLLCIAFTVALTGCQVNVVTAPHAVFKVERAANQ